MSREQLQFCKTSPDIIQARREAEEEYSAFFKEFHPYIVQSYSYIAREIFAYQGMVGYFIRVDIEASDTVLAIMHRWIDALNDGSAPLSYEDAIQYVKDTCERKKKEDGAYPSVLYVDDPVWVALHGTDRCQYIAVPLLSQNWQREPDVHASIAIVQVSPKSLRIIPE